MDGDDWRKVLLNAVLPREGVNEIAQRFVRTPTLGLLAPGRSLKNIAETPSHAGNSSWLKKFMHRLGEHPITESYNFHFPAGSMYWFRIEALYQLLSEDFVSLDEFELEAGQLDGTLAHSIERVVGFLIQKNGFEIDLLRPE